MKAEQAFVFLDRATHYSVFTWKSALPSHFSPALVSERSSRLPYTGFRGTVVQPRTTYLGVGIC